MSKLHRHKLLDCRVWLGIGLRERPSLLLIYLNAKLKRLSRRGAGVLKGLPRGNEPREGIAAHAKAALRIRVKGADVLSVHGADRLVLAQVLMPRSCAWF
jgi:hypothetical protein